MARKTDRKQEADAFLEALIINLISEAETEVFVMY
jgi:hypothetical protein